MKKSLLVATLLLVGVTSVSAAEWFIGVGAERMEIDGSTKVGSLSTTDYVKDTLPRIKAGIILSDNHRISLSYSNLHEGYGDFHTLLYSYDYLFTPQNNFTPFIGLHEGATNGKINYASGMTIDAIGSIYGVQVGALHSINNYISLEASFAYSQSNFKEPLKKNGIEVTNKKFELDTLISLYVGFNYYF